MGNLAVFKNIKQPMGFDRESFIPIYTFYLVRISKDTELYIAVFNIILYKKNLTVFKYY